MSETTADAMRRAATVLEAHAESDEGYSRSHAIMRDVRALRDGADALAKLAADLAAVRKALEGLVGETDPDTLRQMETLFAAVPHPDQAVMLTAIRTLLALAAQEGA